MKVYIITHLYEHEINSYSQNVQDAQLKVDDWAREKGWSIQWEGEFFGTILSAPPNHEESTVIGRFLIL